MIDYDAVVDVDRLWVAQGIGVSEGAIDRSADPDGRPGDEVGKIAAAAYRQGSALSGEGPGTREAARAGAEEAAKVLRAYKRGYDARRVYDGNAPVSDAVFVRRVGTCLGIGLERGQIKEVLDVLSHFPHPLVQLDEPRY